MLKPIREYRRARFYSIFLKKYNVTGSKYNYVRLQTSGPENLPLYTFRSLMCSFLPKNNFLKNIFDFTATGDWNCVAAVERLPAIQYSEDFIFLSFGAIKPIVDL